MQLYNYKSLLSVFFVLSVVLNLCNGATIYPKSLKTESGSASATAVSALKTKDQSGSQDSFSKYVEFYGKSQSYRGVFTFDFSGVNAAAVSSFKLDVNFRGPKLSNQEWTFEYFVPKDNTWIPGGDNTDAASWSWSALSFCGPAPLSTLVSNGNLQIRLSSVSSGDDCDIDYLAITTTEGSSSSTGSSNPTPTTKPTATTKPTSAPKPTEAPKPTKAPKPTDAPKATAAPTTKPPASPTTRPSNPTTAPTSKPSNPTTPTSPGGRICPAGQVWAPAPGTTWQWQLTGTIDQSWDVQMYDIDLFDATADLISQLHSKGRAVICYFSTQYENWRPDASKFTTAVLGSNLDDWPGEKYADIRSPLVRQIMAERLDLAVSKGCDGVEPDNVDGYANKNGLGLTAADQIDYNKFLASESHKRGLSVGLKNDLDQVAQLVPYFDWALNEQCNQYGECGDLSKFITAGKAVFGVEYSGSASSVCPKMITAKMSWLMKDLDLGAKGTQCCASAAGGCAKVPYKCITY